MDLGEAPENRTTRKSRSNGAPAGSGDTPQPSFSIVIPTYQRREVVCEAIKCLANIIYYGPVELIVVVDGSTDGTVEALTQVDLPFPFRVVTQPNSGASHARNRGAAEAQNEILLFLDDDMMCKPDLVEQHARMYREGADAVIGSTPTHPDSDPGFLSESVRRWIENEQVLSPLSHWDVFSGQLSVRKSAFNAVGGFDERFTTGSAFSNEDADLGVRLLSRFDVRHNPEAITRQRYVVRPREYMKRAGKAAEGDLLFVRKHPQLSRDVVAARGRTTPLSRFVYIPLSRIPLLPRLLTGTLTLIGELALKTPFRSNRTLARFFSGSRSIAYWARWRAGWQIPGTERLLVLCYHSIKDQSDDPLLAPYGVEPSLFAKQLDVLLDAGFSFVSPDAFANFLRCGAPLPKRPVLLSFDDCYEDLLEVARDVLQPRGIPAIAFAVTATKTGTNEWDQPSGARRLRLLTSEQLRELASLGVEIGSHSRTHRDMTLLSGQEQKEEAAGAAADLQAAGLPRPRFFAYPFGATNDCARKAVEQAGYLAAFGCKTGFVDNSSDHFDLPRVGVFASDRGWRFRVKAHAPRLLVLSATLYSRIVGKFRRIRRATDAVE